jgi:hypothetical protein
MAPSVPSSFPCGSLVLNDRLVQAARIRVEQKRDVISFGSLLRRAARPTHRLLGALEA